MGVNETLQQSWEKLSPKDKRGLLARIGRKEANPVDNTDEMDSKTRGRLIVALRDGKTGFSVEEYNRGVDFYQNRKPGKLVRMIKGVQYKIDRLFYPNLHE